MSDADEITVPVGNESLSIVIPVYRSEKTLPATLERLDALFDRWGMKHEVIFVNDGSPDGSWEVLEQLAEGRDDVIAIDLMRNYGQHSAMVCGLENASGDYVLTMDDDLQNPPEEIPKLVAKIREGYDVVFGEFEQKMHGFGRRIGSRIINWLNKKLFGKPDDLVLTNFRIMRREVVDAVCEFRTSMPYLPGLLLMNGRRFGNVLVEHHARAEGQSNYTFKVIATLVWRIVFNYSAFPLRAFCAVGALFALLAFLIGIFYLVKALIYGTESPGWPTLVVLLSFFQGVILIVLSALGEYLVRLVNDVSRQAYRVRRKL